MVARDPVCGMNVREDDKDNNLRSEYRGQNYHFCSDKCRQEFDRNPVSFTRDDQNREKNQEQKNRPENKDDRRPR
jgi:YHS domain-containing protein